MNKQRKKPQETLDFKLNKQLEFLSFSPSINLVEEGKHFLAVASFEAANSVFNVTHENNTFSITAPGHWFSKGDAETFNELRELLGLRAQNDFELHVEENRKIGNQIKMRDNKNI